MTITLTHRKRALLEEDCSHSSNEEITRPLWNMSAHYRVDKIPLLDPILSQLNEVHIRTSYLTLLNIILPSSLGI